MIGLEKYRKIFFIGIGGIGMSAIAVILKERGFEVCGSDRAESSTTRGLAVRGIDVRIGHSAGNITAGIDAVVFTNAVSGDNPELERARELGIDVYERAEMLDRVARPKFTIGVSGTHGKTTTTSMVSKIFLHAGLEPALAVGGYLDEIGGSGREGRGKYFVYEACEAYSSFLKLHPNMALITNIDADHLDYYGTLDNIKKAFKKYIEENIPPFGLLIYNRDDAALREVVESSGISNRLSVGIDSADADFTAADINLLEFASSFTVRSRGRSIGEFFVNIPGRHNVTNALLAIAAGFINGVSREVVASTLARFKNADRRFQLKLNREGLMVIDDYAHHPAEINATLHAARNLSDRKNARLIAVFQPHLYSRTEFLYKDFAASLSLADGVVLTEIYAARENNVNNISSRIIYDEIVKIKGEGSVVYSRELKEVPEKVKPLLGGSSIIITLGAGDVWKVSDMFGGN